MTDASELLVMIQDAKDSFKALVPEFRKVLGEAVAERVTPILTKMNEVYGSTGIVVGGYTPAWNDGDVCTHSMYYFEVDEYQENLEDPNYPIEDINIIGLDEIDCPAEDRARMRKCLVANERVGLPREIENFNYTLDDLLEMIYGTNYAVFFELQEDGTVTASHYDLQPEY